MTIKYENLSNPTTEEAPFQRAVKMAPGFVAAAEAFGLKGNDAVVAANTALRNLVGVDLLSAMAPDDDDCPCTLLTISDMSDATGIPEVDIKESMEGAGVLRRVYDGRYLYELTPKGSQYVAVFDDELMWKPDVMNAIDI